MYKAISWSKLFIVMAEAAGLVTKPIGVGKGYKATEITGPLEQLMDIGFVWLLPAEKDWPEQLNEANLRAAGAIFNPKPLSMHRSA